MGYVDEAREKGLRVIQPDVYADGVADPATRQLPLTLVIDPDKRLALHKQEISDPVLSAKTDRQRNMVLRLGHLPRR